MNFIDSHSQPYRRKDRCQHYNAGQTFHQTSDKQEYYEKKYPVQCLTASQHGYYKICNLCWYLCGGKYPAKHRCPSNQKAYHSRSLYSFLNGINERFNSNLMIDKGQYKAVNNSYCGRLSGGEDASIYPAKYDNRQQ